MVEVFIEKSNEEKIVEAKDGLEVLDRLKINPETVLIVKDNEIITSNAKLDNSDKIKLLSVISGG